MRKNLKPASVPVLSKLLISLSFLLFFSATAFSQTVSGVVTDATNQPLSGVTVQVKNTSRATVTNDAGRFQINASANEVLVISSVGFTQQEVPVNNRGSLSIRLAIGTSNFWLSFVLLVIAGTAMYAPYGPFFAIIPEILPGNVTAGAIALINSLGALGSFAGSYLVGYLNGTTGGFGASYIFMAGSLFISAILTMVAVKEREVVQEQKLVEEIA